MILKRIANAPIMKIILFFSGILLSLALDAQDTTKSSTDPLLDSLIIQANSLLKDKLTDSAQVTIAKAVLWTLDHHGLNSTAYAELCILYGKLNQQKNDHPETVKWFQQAISIRKELLGTEDTLYASALHQLGAEYEDKNMHSLALDLYSEALVIREKVYGKLHPDYLNSLSGLAYIHSQFSDFAKAEAAYLEVKNYTEQLYGKNHLDYAQSVYKLGRFYQQSAQYNQSEMLLLEAKAIRESISGKSSKIYLSSLFSLAYLYATMEKYNQAELMYYQGLTEWENNFDKIDDLYIKFTLGLALLYVKTNQYSKAEPLLIETLRIREIIQGKLNPYYIWELSQLANLFLNTGQYEKAEKLYKEKLTIAEILYGNLSAAYSNDLAGLASLYNSMGQYEKAEPLYLEAIQIKENTIGKNDLNYAGNLGNLAILYLNTGMYEKAEKLLIQNLAIVENKVGSDHIEMIFPLTNLSLVYDRLGLYEKSIEIKIKVNKLIAAYYSEKHPYYSTGLHNLATAYTTMGRYTEAIQLFKSFIPLRKEILGEWHHDYATSLLGISMAYLGISQYPEAFIHLNEARNIMKKGVGTLHPQYVHSLNVLGNYYQRTSQYENAETYFSEARMLSEQIHGSNHPYTILYTNNLALIYMKQKKYEKARMLIESNTLLHQSQVDRGLYHLSEQELNQYLSSTEDYQAHLYSMASNYQIQTSTPTPLSRLCYNNALFYKGFLLQASQQIYRMAIKNPASAEKYTQLKSYKSRLAKEYALPVMDRDSTAIVDLELKSNTLEKALAGELSGFRETVTQVNSADVQHQLKPGEVCIEFVHYTNYDNQFTDSILYAALILRPGTTDPTFISLFEEKELQKLLQNHSDHRADYVNSLYAYSERGMVKLGQSRQSLYELIWQKLEMEGLSEVHTIYFALTGELHRINLGAIPINDAEMLSDKYTLIMLNSTRQLVEKDSGPQAHQPGLAMLFSDIEFDADTSTIHSNEVTDEMNHITLRGLKTDSSGDREGEVSSWSTLSWTAKEGRLIEEILTATNHPVQHFKKTDASEEKFKQISSSNKASPQIIHLATHGYFFPDPISEPSGIDVSGVPVFISSENPMIRSGLILAGGNFAWQNGTPLRNDMEDGILTAYEISQLDLTNTELVVLSACETGLGDIHGNEGVYGLQRAYKIAGARYLIMSLWKVPDRESGEFMASFYRNWLEGKLTIPDAFRKTQREMRDRFFNPYSWAAFVLVE